MNRLTACIGWALLACSLTFAVWQFSAYFAYVADPYLLDGDLNQHLSPFYAQRSPDLFRDRFLTDYSAAYLPLAYKALLSALARVMDPVLATKWLGLGCLLATWAGAALLAGRWGGPVPAAMTLALMAQCSFLNTQLHAGLFRSFAAPLILLYIHAASSRRLHWAGLALIGQALFYPPIVFVCAPVHFLATGVPALRGRQWRRLAVLALYAVTVGGILLAYKSSGAAYGAIMPLATAQFMPEWHSGGRLPELPFPPPARDILAAAAHAFDHPMDLAWAEGTSVPRGVWRDGLVLIFFALGGAACLKSGYAGRILAGLGLSSVALYAASRAVAFHLGYPSRYVEYSLPLIALLAWGPLWNVARAAGAAWPRWIACALAAGFWLVFPVSTRPGSSNAGDYSVYAGVVEFLRVQPDTMLVAALPHRAGVADCLPLLARKEAYINYEHAQPVYQAFYARARDRVLRVLHITTTSDALELARLQRESGITHFIQFKRQGANGGAEPGLTAPFTEILQHLHLASKARGGGILNGPLPPECVIYEDDSARIIDLAGLTRDTALPETRPAATTTGTVFSAGCELVSVSPARDSARAGETVDILYRWRCPPYVAWQALTVLVHFERYGKKAFQGDHGLLQGVPHPAVFTQRDDAIFEYTIAQRIPNDAPPGAYRMRVGIYRADTGQRSRITNPPEPQDSLLLKTALTVLPAP